VQSFATTGRISLPLRLGRVCAAGLTLSVAATSFGAAHADASPPVDPAGRGYHAVEPSVETGNLEALTRDGGWGSVLIEGSFGVPVAIPGEASFLTIDTSVNQLVRYDIDTNELTYGGAVPGATEFEILISPDKTWVYVVTPLSVANPGVVRLRLDTLQVDRAIDLRPMLPPGSVGGPTPQVAIVPDDENRIVARFDRNFGIFDDGALVGSVTSFGAVFPPDLIVVAERYGYELRSDGSLWAFEIGASGVTVIPSQVASGFDPLVPLSPVNGELLRNGELLSIPALVPRVPQPSELYQLDPVIPVAYETTTRLFGGTVTTIRNAETFDVITSGIDCADPGAILIGNGFTVVGSPVPNFDGPLLLTYLPDRCGGYGEYHAVDPARIVDTRDGSGGNAVVGRRTAGLTTRVRVHGLGGVPATGVESVVLNVTAVNQQNDPDGTNFLTVWPAGSSQPTVSNLNVPNGRTVGNQVTVATSADGYVDVYSDGGDVDLTVDVAGYFGSALSPRGARFISSSAERIVDTRFFDRPLGPAESIPIQTARYVNGLDLGGLRGAEVVAVALNVTAIQPSEQGFIRLYEPGAALPTSSSMNFDPRGNTARSVVAPVGPDGVVMLRNEVGTVDVAVDIVGVYVFAGDTPETLGQSGRFLAIEPDRDVDTRLGSPFDGDGRLEPDSFLIIPGYLEGVLMVTNVTAVRTDATGFLSAGPWGGTGENLLSTSSLNYWSGSNIANETMIQADNNGEIAVYSSEYAHVLIDVFGYYT
jgi:hypothetical protein